MNSARLTNTNDTWSISYANFEFWDMCVEIEVPIELEKLVRDCGGYFKRRVSNTVGIKE